MKTLTDELREWRMSEKEIKRILSIVKSSKVARTFSAREINSIFCNDEGNAEMEYEDNNGNLRIREYELA